MRFIHGILITFLLFTFACNSSKQKEQSVASSEENYPPEAVTRGSSDTPDETNDQQLLKAALEGQSKTVQKLLDQGVSVNATDEEGRTPLMLAAYNGHTDTGVLLVEAGSDVNVIDSDGRTALMYASTGPFPEMVRFLLQKGAKINLADKQEHFTALMYAASEGLPEVTKILLENGADPDLKDVDGDRALNFASNNKHQEVVELLKSWKK